MKHFKTYLDYSYILVLSIDNNCRVHRSNFDLLQFLLGFLSSGWTFLDPKMTCLDYILYLHDQTSSFRSQRI